MEIIVEDGGEGRDTEFPPAEFEKLRYGLEILLLDGTTAIGSDVGFALSPIDTGIGNREDTGRLAHRVPRCVVAAPSQRITDESAQLLEGLSMDDILHHETVDLVGESLFQEVTRREPFVEVLFDESLVGCGFAFAVDDSDVEMEESLVGMQLQHAIETFYAVVVHLVVVAEQPQPLLILCQGNAAFPLPDQVGGSQIAVEARVMQIHFFFEGHHNL